MAGIEAIPTTHSLAARLLLFLPSQRPTVRNGDWVETSWGRCRVFGRLGQRHADALEALLFNAEDWYDEPSGVIELLVDPAMVRKTLSDSRYSFDQIWCLIREIRASTVEIDTKHFRLMGGLIESVEYTKQEVRRDPLTGGNRRLWTVRLGKVWSKLLRKGVRLTYDPAPIARLKHGISQAVARFLLSHSGRNQPNGGWKILTVIRSVAPDLPDQGLRNAKRRLAEDSAALAGMGIHLTRDRRFIVDSDWQRNNHLEAEQASTRHA